MGGAQQRKYRYVVVLSVTLLGVLVLRQVAALSDITMVILDLSCPLLVSSHAIARNLASDRGDLVYDSLEILSHRRDPIAVGRAIQLLQSDDDYAWLNAAQYLGACGRQEAVPYLIKALRHTAWRSDSERAQYLKSLTSQDFGTDFQKWKSWWEQTHADSHMDWESHLGYSPRLGR
jgi:hypothetical protein